MLMNRYSRYPAIVTMNATLWAGLLACLLLIGSVVLHGAAFVTFEQLTVGAAAVPITSTTLDPSGQGQMTQCTVRLETAEIRYRYDGTVPTATVGTLLEIGDILSIDNHADAQALRFIRTGGTSGVLDITCWRE